MTGSGPGRRGRRAAGASVSGRPERARSCSSRKVLGKHIPVPAARLPACRHGARASPWPGDPRRARRVDVDAARRGAARRRCRSSGWRDSTVIGFAETATGLAHQVAEALDARGCRTRRATPDCARAVSFDESHSHAREPVAARAARGRCPDGPLVIVDDELSTGATAAKLIALLHAARAARALRARLPGRRAPRRPGRWRRCAAELGVPIDVVSLRAPGRARSCRQSGWSRGALPERGRRARSSRSCADADASSGRARRERHGLGPRGAGARSGELAAAAAELGPLPHGRARARLRRASRAAAAAPRWPRGPSTLVSSTTRSAGRSATRPAIRCATGSRSRTRRTRTIAGLRLQRGAGARGRTIVVHFAEPRAPRARRRAARARWPPSLAVTAVTLR